MNTRKRAYPKTKGVCLNIWQACDKLLHSGKFVCTQNILHKTGLEPKLYRNTVSVEMSAWKKFHGLDGI